mgnify:CR=1 FL=1
MPDYLEARAAAFLALAEKATKGRWAWSGEGRKCIIRIGDGLLIADFWAMPRAQHNLRLAIFGHNDAPELVRDLLAEVLRLRKESHA